MALHVRAERDGTTLHVTVVGELDAHTAPSVAEVLDPILVDPDLDGVIVDASDLSFMDTVGISEFLRIQRVLAERGAFIRLHRASPSVRKVLDVTGLLETFGVE